MNNVLQSLVPHVTKSVDYATDDDKQAEGTSGNNSLSWNGCHYKAYGEKYPKDYYSNSKRWVQ